MSTIDSMVTRLDQLVPGDRVEVEYHLDGGKKMLKKKAVGTFVRSERHAGGIHFRPKKDKSSSKDDSVLLQLTDGEFASIAVDDDTIFRRA
jgi:hypothetical protein